MSREELQSQSLQLVKNHSRVALQWCTGLGKSRAAIQAANYLAEQKEDLKVLLVVAEVAHKSNWEDEFIRWSYKVPNTIIECYASLKKYRDTEWDLIIFDEAHHLGSDLRIDVLTSISAKNVILLSATLPDQTMQSITGIFGEFAVSRVTLKQAIEWGALPKPKVFLVPLNLNSTYSNCIITEEWGRKEKRVTYKCKFNERWEYLRNKTKYPNVTLEISCTQQQKYDYLTEQFEYWRSQFFRTRQEFTRNKWLQVGSKRKRFLGECKTDATRLLLHKIQDRRLICFCSSIEQAELLGGKNAIHSKRDDSLDVIDSFNTKQIDSLFAVGMLQEGQNLTDIEAGIIVQLDGQERAFVQKFGRSLRADTPIQFIFYYKDTRDVDYLDNVLEGIDLEYIIEVDNLIDFEI
jgi:superfamily II DNA or RNA helicase